MVNQQPECEGLAAQAKVFASSVLQQREAENQPSCPQRQQEYQRERSEVTEEIFAPRVTLKESGNPSPWNPGSPIERGADAEGTAHPPRQHHGLECIEQDGED